MRSIASNRRLSLLALRRHRVNWQIHRSTIVNVEAIESVTKGIAGVSVKLRRRPTRLPVSEAYRHLFRHM